MGTTTSGTFQSVLVGPDPPGTLRRFVGQVHKRTVIYTFSRPVPIPDVVAFHERYRHTMTDRQRGIEIARMMELHLCIVCVEPLVNARSRAA